MSGWLIRNEKVGQRAWWPYAVILLVQGAQTIIQVHSTWLEKFIITSNNWTKHSKHSRSWEKNCTRAAMNCNMKSGCCRAKNDCLEMASEKTDPKRLTRPLDTNKYTTINYSTNTLKYIPHARQTNIQKSQRAKTKDTNKQVFSSLHS